jgi:hypothetical protein
MFAMYIDSDRGDRVNWIKYPGCATELQRTQNRGRDQYCKLLVRKKRLNASACDAQHVCVLFLGR